MGRFSEASIKHDPRAGRSGFPACVDGGVADEVLALGQIGFEISKFGG